MGLASKIKIELIPYREDSPQLAAGSVSKLDVGPSMFDVLPHGIIPSDGISGMPSVL
jgi:hypothetical protein